MHAGQTKMGERHVLNHNSAGAFGRNSWHLQACSNFPAHSPHQLALVELMVNCKADQTNHAEAKIEKLLYP